ncbi:MAG: acyltransferase family protein [Anaerolineae bacterium]|nr:acyltransferase family protein [Anaerolineae bacterium]
MTEQTSAKPRTRLFYLDNLRIYLTILVILHHAALAYGGMGNWDVKDPAVDEISPIFLLFFNAVNQTYFMSAFFLLAGYFTPRSFERKGSKQFLIDRLIRLGIPIVFYTTIILNITDYILKVYYRGIPFLISDIRIVYQPSHLWFLQALLFFAVIYVIFRALTQSAPIKSIQLYRDSFPPDAILFLCIAILTVLTFIEHLVFPVGKAIFLNFQAGFFVHYTFCFYIGVLAYRGDWFRRLSKAQARRWGILSLVVILLFFPLLILGGALESEENLAKFTGGLHWQSLVFSLWLTFLMVGIIVFLLYFFRERLNQAGPIAKSMAANVYTVYIIHQTVLVALHILMLPVPIPTIVKFVIVSAIAVPVCFLLSSLIRRIPYARRVLG